MGLKFEDKYFCNINGTIVPDYSEYTKEALAGEIVRQREIINRIQKENQKLNKQLRELTETFRQATIDYLDFMKQVDYQLHVPFWHRYKIGIPYYNMHKCQNEFFNS